MTARTQNRASFGSCLTLPHFLFVCFFPLERALFFFLFLLGRVEARSRGFKRSSCTRSAGSKLFTSFFGGGTLAPLGRCRVSSMLAGTKAGLWRHFHPPLVFLGPMDMLIFLVPIQVRRFRPPPSILVQLRRNLVVAVFRRRPTTLVLQLRPFGLPPFVPT